MLVVAREIALRGPHARLSADKPVDKRVETWLAANTSLRIKKKVAALEGEKKN